MKKRLFIVLGLISPFITITLLMVVHGIPIHGTTAEGRLLFLSQNFALFACVLARQFLESRMAKPPTTGWGLTSCLLASWAVGASAIFELVRLTPFRPTQDVTMTILAAMLLSFCILSVLIYRPKTGSNGGDSRFGGTCGDFTVKLRLVGVVLEVLLLAASAFSLFTVFEYASAQQATAHVTAAKLSESKRKCSMSEVYFEFELENKKFTGFGWDELIYSDEQAKEFLAKYPVGQVLEIRYFKDDPKRSFISRQYEVLFAGMVGSLLGFLGLAITCSPLLRTNVTTKYKAFLIKLGMTMTFFSTVPSAVIGGLGGHAANLFISILAIFALGCAALIWTPFAKNIFRKFGIN